jgi:hypothetical protein
MEKKQTAVQWLAEQITTSKWKFADITDRNIIIEQALQMEREQMRKTYSHGWTTRERFDDLVRDIIYPLGLDYEEKQEYAFQQYYEQTYGGQDER